MDEIKRVGNFLKHIYHFLLSNASEILSVLASLLVFQDICIQFQVESELWENTEM